MTAKLPLYKLHQEAKVTNIEDEDVVRDKAATSAEGRDCSHATPAVEGVGQVQGWQSVCRWCPTHVRSHLSAVYIDKRDAAEC